MSQPQTAQSVQKGLDENGLQCKLIEIPATTKTIEDHALLLNCQAAQIIKSLIFKTANTGRPVLILASLVNRVNEKTMREYIGEPIVKADANFAKEVTGFSIGNISPIGHKTPIELIFIDSTLMDFEDIWASAGTQNTVFNMKMEDFKKITNGKIVSIT